MRGAAGAAAPSLAEQIVEVEREIALRQRVYTRRVAAGGMTSGAAARHIALMQAALESLHRLEGLER